MVDINLPSSQIKGNEKIGTHYKFIKERRRLAAIMVTDIVSYTVLMSKDEQKALKLLWKSRNVLRSLIHQFNGAWLKDIGDGTLSSFESAVEAVKCALEIQRVFSNDPDLKLRIGIHIGDVVFADGDVFGDGVNVASRIEPLAGPGDICVSKHVYDKIKNFPDIKTLSLGIKELKNVEEPLEIYEVVPELTLFADSVKQVVTEPHEAANSIAVLPFTNMSADPNQEYFCDGMTEELINMLTHVKGLRVVARTSSFMFKDKREDVREIGRKLNVETLLEGSVRKVGNRLRISAQLINVADGYHLWSEQYDRNTGKLGCPEDIFCIQDEISLAIVGKLKLKLLNGEKTKLMKRRTGDLGAYKLYLKGRWFSNKRTEDGIREAIKYFNLAIKKYPDYALSHAGLAHSYFLLPAYSSIPPKGAFPKARAAAMKALEVDDRLAEAHLSLAELKHYSDWDWKGAEKEYKQAIELNPGYAATHQAYAFYLIDMVRFEEAIEEMKRALELDPLSVIIQRNVGQVFFYARQYDRALKALQKATEMDQNFSLAHFYSGCAYAQKSMYKEALTEFYKEKDISNGFISYVEARIGAVYALMDKKDKTRQVLEKLIKRSKSVYISSCGLAWIYFALGDNDAGFLCLEKAFKERDVWLSEIKIEPLFDSVRSDPRFTTLLTKMGLKKPRAKRLPSPKSLKSSAKCPEPA